MIGKDRIALNRMAAPALHVEDFYRLASECGLGKVELRNDIPGKGIVDGLSLPAARTLARKTGIRVLTINAQQKFNLADRREIVRRELEDLLRTAAELECEAVILCPNCDAADDRSPPRRLAETAESLADFAPLFERCGVTGHVEPLGFGVSSLSSIAAAAEAIRRSGAGCYRVVHDTFHSHIGPAAGDYFPAGIKADLIGLVHISGVEADIPASEFRDAHRLFPGPGDRTSCREQLALLLRHGYAGDVSFEPFAPELGEMSAEQIGKLVRAAIAYIS